MISRKKVTIKSAAEKQDPEEEVRKDIGRRIKEMRTKLRLTASQVAQRLKMSREALTHIETGRNNVSAVSLWKLAVLFHCDIQDFFPVIPDGYQLTKVDIKKLAQEDEKAPQWAEKMFGPL